MTEIKDLRHSGKLDEALTLAKVELNLQPNNVWTKRNISWVYYDLIKVNNNPDEFLYIETYLLEISNLNLPSEDKMVFDQLAWQIGKLVTSLIKLDPARGDQLNRLFEMTQRFHFTKPSASYSFLLKSFHKAFKNTDTYLRFIDWWNLEYLMPDDFVSQQMPNGKNIMSIAEQAYIAMSKQLLPKHEYDSVVFNEEKAKSFLPQLSKLIRNHSDFEYPPYFKAKLLLALGEKEKMLITFLPFARKKNNSFWIWEVLGEVYSDDSDKNLACYCKALSCGGPEKMLVKLRQHMASIFLKRGLLNEAKTEIETLRKTRESEQWNIPNEILYWESQAWFKSASSSKSNSYIYKKHLDVAEDILYREIKKETIIIESINDKDQTINFIASDTRFGFFKHPKKSSMYEIGDVLSARFDDEPKGNNYKILTLSRTQDAEFKGKFLKTVSGKITILKGKPFGFISDVFVHPSIVAKNKLTNGDFLQGEIIKSYNGQKKEWGWKLVKILPHESAPTNT